MANNQNICECFACNIPNLDTIKLQKHNGVYLPLTTKITNCLKEQIVFGQDIKQSSFTIEVLPNKEIIRPLQIIDLLDKTDDTTINSTTDIILRQNSSITIIYCDDSLPKTQINVSHKINVVMEENASLTIYKMQNVNNSTTLCSEINFDLNASCHLSSYFLTLNGGQLDNKIKVNFLKDNSTADINGLYLMDKSQKVKTNIDVFHYKDHCISNQLFKGIMDDTSEGEFYGHIFVDYNAKNNIAKQKNNNILLTDKAKANSEPILEIYNDEVECSHGATVGQLDEMALYYLRTRGIDTKGAKMLLLEAFCQEVLAKSKIPSLKEGLTLLIQKRLAGGLNYDNPFSIDI